MGDLFDGLYFARVKATSNFLPTCLSMGAGENWSLRLYQNNIPPSETDVAATYTAAETAFTGYAPKVLTRTIGASTWNTPTNGGPDGLDPVRHP